MANPQRENGHIDIANEIAEKFASYRLSGQEWQILWVILRKTWGWLVNPDNKHSPKKKLDKIPLSQFQILTGIDRRKCHILLKNLVKKKILKRVVTHNGDRTIITYGIQKDYDQWILSPKKVTVTNKDDKLTSKKVSKLSPKKTLSKEKKETIQKKENYTSDFLKFWEAYPKKNKKPLTFQKWKEKKKALPKLSVILRAIEQQKKYRQIKKSLNQFVAEWQDPERWIKNHRWEDEIEKIKDPNDLGYELECLECHCQYKKDKIIDNICPNCQRERKFKEI